MDNLRPISPTMSIAGQPTEGDFRDLKGDGYAAVVNLRCDGEPEQPIGTAAEGELARSIGLDYFHLPVGPKPLAACRDEVAALFDFLDRHAGEKVLVHCRSGGRAGAIVALHRAKAERWPPEEFRARSEAMGISIGPGLRANVEDFLGLDPPA